MFSPLFTFQGPSSGRVPSTPNTRGPHNPFCRRGYERTRQATNEHMRGAAPSTQKRPHQWGWPRTADFLTGGQGILSRGAVARHSPDEHQLCRNPMLHGAADGMGQWHDSH